MTCLHMHTMLLMTHLHMHNILLITTLHISSLLPCFFSYSNTFLGLSFLISFFLFFFFLYISFPFTSPPGIPHNLSHLPSCVLSPRYLWSSQCRNKYCSLPYDQSHHQNTGQFQAVKGLIPTATAASFFKTLPYQLLQLHLPIMNHRLI